MRPPRSQPTDTGLWLPRSLQDLKALPASDLVHDTWLSKVVSTGSGVVIKYPGRFEEEIRAQRFAREKLSLPVPRILYHPPMRHHAWYICMERCPGTSLDKVVDTMTPSELDHVAAQLKSILSRMAAFKPRTLGSVTGGPYRNFYFPGYVSPKHAFANVAEFNDYHRWMLMLFCTEEFTESLISRLPRNAAKRFAHGDLVPKNIMVDGSTITGIIDWETAGLWPEYWEYCRMHAPPIFLDSGLGLCLAARVPI